MQFLETHTGLLVNILNQSLDEVNNNNHLNAPEELHDRGMPMGNVDLEVGNDQPHDAMMGPQDDNGCGAQHEDLRLMPGIQHEDTRLTQEDAFQLDVERELHDLGSKVFSVAEKDSIKAMALKIGNQLTRRAFQGVQKLTQGHMEIDSEYVAGCILKCPMVISAQS